MSSAPTGHTGRRHEAPEIEKSEARQGVELHRMRWVLGASVAAVVVIFIALLISFT